MPRPRRRPAAHRDASPAIRTLLVLSVLLAGAWYTVRGRYYSWVLERAGRVDLTVMCDTTSFDARPDTATILYDRVALAPLSVAWGLFANRDPEKVRTYLFRTFPVDAVERDSVWVRGVPFGPIARIQFSTPRANYFVDVRDRRPVGDRLIVWAEWPGGRRITPVRTVGGEREP